MKTINGILTAILLCYCAVLTAQKKDSICYGGMQQISPSFGNGGASIGLTVINGIRFNHFFTGIGADYLGNQRYNTYSAPLASVFFDARYYPFRSKRFFVKGDAGLNFIAGQVYAWSALNSEVTKKTGYYWGTGLGFKARLSKELFYVFDVSYVVRQTTYDFRYQDWRFPNEWFTENRNNIRPMIVVNMGLEIF